MRSPYKQQIEPLANQNRYPKSHHRRRRRSTRGRRPDLHLKGVGSKGVSFSSSFGPPTVRPRVRREGQVCYWKGRMLPRQQQQQ